MQKSFKEYLLESKQNYEFKIKIVGDVDKEQADKLESALVRFKVESFSEGKRTPIQKSQVDFPDYENTEVTIFDVSLAYPATSNQLRDIVAAALDITHDEVKIRNTKEQEEDELNAKYEQNNLSGEANLGKPYDKSDHQDIVGDKHTMSLLKELNKTKKTGTQYKGVNDKILAKKSPVDKTPTVKTGKSTKPLSPVGSIQNKIPSPIKGK